MNMINGQIDLRIHVCMYVCIFKPKVGYTDINTYVDAHLNLRKEKKGEMTNKGG